MIRHRNNIMVLGDILEQCTEESTYSDVRSNVTMSPSLISKYINIMLRNGLLFKIIYKRVGKPKIREGYKLMTSHKGRCFLKDCRMFKESYRSYLGTEVF